MGRVWGEEQCERPGDQKEPEGGVPEHSLQEWKVGASHLQQSLVPPGSLQPTSGPCED